VCSTSTARYKTNGCQTFSNTNMTGWTERLWRLRELLNGIVENWRWDIFHGVPSYLRPLTKFGIGKGSQHAKRDAIGMEILWWQARKAGMEHDLNNIHLPQEQTAANLKKAYRLYQWLKNDPAHCNTWLAQLVEAQAKACNLTTRHIWCQFFMTENIQTTAHQVNYWFEESC